MKYIIRTMILLLFFWFVSARATGVAAQFETTTVAGDPSQITKSEYTLPYPGILPDHPLYKIKTLRDVILEFVISDPIKKTEFYILQADKRLGMGIALFSEGKKALAETTISKGTKYMARAVAGITTYKKSGTPIPGYIQDRIEKSLTKQKEVVSDLITQTEETIEKTGLTASLEILDSLFSEVTKLNN